MTELKYRDQQIHHDPRFTLQKWDVWGLFTDDHERVHSGMVVARQDTLCPVWGDVVPYKSATIVCQPDQEGEVDYWIGYVQGGGPSARKVLDDGRIALRSDYHAW